MVVFFKKKKINTSNVEIEKKKISRKTTILAGSSPKLIGFFVNDFNFV